MDKKIFKQQLLDELYAPYRTKGADFLQLFGCTRLVLGEGNPNAAIMFIGEAPGREEDEQGRPFVGRSGQLFTRALTKLGVQRDEVFITNLVKCRPPNNRTPLPHEVDLFKSLLLNEIKIVRPKAICTLGASALNGLFDQIFSITKIRGKELHFNSIPLIPTFHPAYVLRNPASAHNFLADIKKVMSYAQK